MFEKSINPLCLPLGKGENIFIVIKILQYLESNYFYNRQIVALNVTGLSPVSHLEIDLMRGNKRCEAGASQREDLRRCSPP